MNTDVETLLGLAARHALTSLAGVLVTHGYLQSSAAEAFVGAGMLFIGVGWSWWQKTGQAAVEARLRGDVAWWQQRAQAKPQAQSPQAVQGAKP